METLLKTPPSNTPNGPLLPSQVKKNRNLSTQRDAARLKICVIATEDAFLLRDVKLDRDNIRSGNRDPYWSNLAALLNEASNQEVKCNRNPAIDEFHRFVFDHSGFVGASKLLRKKTQRDQG